MYSINYHKYKLAANTMSLFILRIPEMQKKMIRNLPKGSEINVEIGGRVMVFNATFSYVVVGFKILSDFSLNVIFYYTISSKNTNLVHCST